VSPDSEKSHQKFHREIQTTVYALADTDHSIADAYGVYGAEEVHGANVHGNSSNNVSDRREGKIKKVFEKVKPEDHADEVLGTFSE
jgi:peroxiredoxin Q/BCP